MIEVRFFATLREGRCKMCFRHSWSGERFGDLDPAVFMRVMDDPVLSAAETVFFGGMGEPLVHPALAEMASLASARGKQVELVTNGTLLTREKARELLAADVSRIWVSIDELYDNLSVSAYMNSSMRPACSAAVVSCRRKTRPTVSALLRPPAAAASGARALPCVLKTVVRCPIHLYFFTQEVHQ